MTAGNHLKQLSKEARVTNHRRMALFTGPPEAGIAALEDVLGRETLTDWHGIGDIAGPWTNNAYPDANTLLGQTIDGLALDLRSRVEPNRLGQTIGAVQGGSLIALFIEDPATWMRETLDSDKRFAIPPYEATAVGHRFRERLWRLLHQHQGISILHPDRDEVILDGRTSPRKSPSPPTTISSPSGSEDDPLTWCRTADQRRLVRQLMAIGTETDVIVAEAHRGRGKSSAAGIAAAFHARRGRTVAVTGPGPDRVEPVFEMAESVLDSPRAEENGLSIETRTGRIDYRKAGDLTAISEYDVLFVDEAAAIPVQRLSSLNDESLPIAFLTTIHGYEGTGRGFDVRFRRSLERSSNRIRTVKLRQPIRFAMNDPIERWQFRTLQLAASPPPDQLIEQYDLDEAAYTRVNRDDLVSDENYLSELYGLLVLAHYRTEPDDLKRLLDAPNVSIRSISIDGHPISVALLAEEGNLSPTQSQRLHEGGSIRGHLIPDLLSSQLRDPHAGEPTGLRILRIVTHPAAQSNGLGSRLLEAIEREWHDSVDYLGTAFGMTPRLLSFWTENGFEAVHLGVSRNSRSGEHSAVMLSPLSPAGHELTTRHRQRLLDRLPGQCVGPLRDMDPETLLTALATVNADLELAFSPWIRDLLAVAPEGRGRVSMAPDAFRQLVAAYFVAGDPAELSSTQRLMLTRRILQGHPWDSMRQRDLKVSRGDATKQFNEAMEAVLSWYDPTLIQ